MTISPLQDNPPAPALPLARSQRLLERARGVYAGLTSTMMKRPDQFAPGQFPVYVSRGEGARVTDVDGNSYIDFICGLGANSLGYCHEKINTAISETLGSGILHSLPIELELKAAEAVLATIPHAQRLRFFKTGADATSASIRLSRAITGRERIAVVGYNGWHDQFMFDTPGVPKALAQLTERFALMAPAQEGALLERLGKGDNDLAAVLLSVPYNRQLSGEFLQQLRAACSRAGTLLVLDEIVTGYRVRLGGIQELHDIEADLVCVSKALAAGMPLSAVVGPERHMSVMEKLQVSTTFGGEALSLAACIAAHSVYRETNYVAHLASLGERLRTGVNRVSEEQHSPLRVVGYDAIPMFLFAKTPPEHVPLATQFVGLMAERGVILRRDVNFLCLAHTTEQIDTTIEATASSLRAMREAGCFDTKQS